MKDKFSLIFNINEMYTYFEKLMKIDMYDLTTLKWYSRNILNELSLQELKKIEDTILNDINKNSRSNSSFWGGLSVLIALFVGIYAILTTLNSNAKLVQSEIIFIFIILIGLLFLIILAFHLENILNKKRNKLHELIRILIFFKEHG